ncbi:hypothetical protein [Sphingobacterium detergens]
MQKWTVIRENAGERPQKGRGNVDEGTWMEEPGMEEPGNAARQWIPWAQKLWKRWTHVTKVSRSETGRLN